MSYIHASVYLLDSNPSRREALSCKLGRAFSSEPVDLLEAHEHPGFRMQPPSVTLVHSRDLIDRASDLGELLEGALRAGGIAVLYSGNAECGVERIQQAAEILGATSSSRI